MALPGGSAAAASAAVAGLIPPEIDAPMGEDPTALMTDEQMVAFAERLVPFITAAMEASAPMLGQELTPPGMEGMAPLGPAGPVGPVVGPEAPPMEGAPPPEGEAPPPSGPTLPKEGEVAGQSVPDPRVPPVRRRSLGAEWNIRKREMARELATMYGAPPGVSGSDPVERLRAWRFVGEKVRADYEAGKSLDVIADELRDKYRAEGLTEEEIEDKVVDDIHPLRRALVRWGRPTFTERVKFCARMEALDLKWKDKELPEPKGKPEKEPRSYSVQSSPSGILIDAPEGEDDEEETPRSRRGSRTARSA